MSRCTCTHAPEQHAEDGEHLFADGSACEIVGCDCPATRADFVEEERAKREVVPSGFECSARLP